jgi:hypothetical protein
MPDLELLQKGSQYPRPSGRAASHDLHARHQGHHFKRTARTQHHCSISSDDSISHEEYQVSDSPLSNISTHLDINQIRTATTGGFAVPTSPNCSVYRRIEIPLMGEKPVANSDSQVLSGGGSAIHTNLAYLK